MVLGFLVPDVLDEAERTAVLFLRGASASALTATELIEHASTTQVQPEPRHLTLPQAPRTVPF